MPRFLSPAAPIETAPHLVAAQLEARPGLTVQATRTLGHLTYPTHQVRQANSRL
jgi:hypothetical protein